MNKVYNLIALISLIGFPCSLGVAQQSTFSIPHSFEFPGDFQALEIQLIPTALNPIINSWAVAYADSVDSAECPDCDWKSYGYGIATNISMTNAGVSSVLSNGDKYWIHKITSQTAFGFQFYFSQFDLPFGATLHIFNENRTMLLGAYTNDNNPSDPNKPIHFGTEPVEGGVVYLEYYEPVWVDYSGQFTISKSIHIFLDEIDFALGPYQDGPLLDCHKNVACQPAGWEKEISSVALILFHNSFDKLQRLCSGNLLNNTEEDGEPYFLSAGHCAKANDAQHDPSTWTFLFNHYSKYCDGTGTIYDGESVYGATLLESDSTKQESDYALMKLNTNLTRLTDFEVCYAGWDKNSPNFSNGPHKAIHHPAGALKKIASGSNDLELYGANNKYFGVWLDDGVTQGGSSGSPLFNADHKVVAHLSGGVNWTNCPPDSYQRYGRFELSWIDGGFEHYLDPNNSAVTTVNTYCPIVPEPIYADPPAITSGGNSCRHDLGSDPMLINGNTELEGIACADLPFELAPYKRSGWTCEENPPVWNLHRSKVFYKCNNLPTWMDPNSCESGIFPFQNNCQCYIWKYFIEITEVDPNGSVIGQSYGNWFTIQNPNWVWGPEYIEVNASDISTLGIPLEQGKYYKIKLATSNYGWKEQTRVFRYCGEENTNISGTIIDDKCTRNNLIATNALISQNATLSGGNSVELNANSTLSYGSLEIFDPNCNNITGYPLNKTSDSGFSFNMDRDRDDGKDDSPSDPVLLLYPNPVYDVITIRISSEKPKQLTYSIRILNAQGQEVKVFPYGGGQEYNLDVRNLPSAPYLILIETPGGDVFTGAFIKS